MLRPATPLSLRPNKQYVAPTPICLLAVGQRFRLWEGMTSTKGTRGYIRRIGLGSVSVVFDEGYEVADFVDSEGKGNRFVARKVKRTEWSLNTLVYPEGGIHNMAENSDGPNDLLEEGRGSRRPISLAPKAQMKEDVMADPKKKVAASKGNGSSKKAAKAENPCDCGCGTLVARRFGQGHDARFYGWAKKIVNGQMEPKDLPNKHVRGLLPDRASAKKALAQHGKH